MTEALKEIFSSVEQSSQGNPHYELGYYKSFIETLAQEFPEVQKKIQARADFIREYYPK